MYSPNLPYPVPPGYYEVVYKRFINLGYVFVGPIYVMTTVSQYEFTTPECSDCSLTGDPNRPDFWVDMY